MSTSPNNVYDLPSAGFAIAVGRFSPETERSLSDLEIVRATNAEEAFVRTARSSSGKLIVDAQNAVIAPASLAPRLILLTTPDCAADALDCLEGGTESVFLGEISNRELADAIRRVDSKELNHSQGPRLVDLSLKMATIAHEIETLLQPPAQPSSLRHVESAAVLTSGPTAPQVRALIRARHARENHFAGSLFADPAWDILLDLFAAHLESKSVSVSSLCIAAAVPPTTALRWIKTMTDSGLLERKADTADGRRIFIDLTERAVAAMQAYFTRSLAAPGGILAA